MIKRVISRFFMILGIFFLIGIMVSVEFRVHLAELVAPFLDPLSMTMPIYWVIIVLSVITAFYTSLIQKLTVDMKKLKSIQKRVMNYQRELMEATKQDNKYKLKQLEEEKKEIQQLQSEMMSMQFKPMFYSMVVTLPIFMWLLEKTKENVSVVVPFSGGIHIADPVIIFPWWLFWYFLCSIAINQVLKKALKM
jgi:uncharacterized membrane protein (DUF106 family)